MTSEQHNIDALFEQLFREHQQPIVNYLCRLVGDVARAEELAQEAFVKAYRSLGRLPQDANRRAWLYRIATNTAYDHLRRRRLIKWLPLRLTDEDTRASVHVEREVNARESVQRALDTLPTAYRAVLVLFSVQGYSTKEISQMLGISQGAVKTRLCRARERFRQAYQGES